MQMEIEKRGMSEQAENAELLKVLESGKIEVVGEIKQVLHENLYTAKDASLLNSLVESYVLSKSENLLGIITGVNESQCQYLFEKMNDLLKRGMQTDVTALLVSVIRQQPSWLYKIVGSSFFGNYLKSLRAEQDVVFLMSGAIILSMLLPCIPSLVAQYLGDILEIFIQMASFVVYKPASLPDILTIHLQIGVYILYHRLYAMYPNNFCSYLRSCFGSKGNDPVFCNVIQPMSQFVKFHPGLILDTSKSETENTKWKMFQPHDVFAECQKISLDPFDAVKEATYTIFSYQGPSTTGVAPKRELVTSTSVTSVDCEEGGNANSNQKVVSNEGLVPCDDRWQKDMTSQTEPASFLSNQEMSLFWSPSFSCGLSTPPSSRTISPSNSTQDIPSLNEFVQRPMTPVADQDKESNMEQKETRTSTPNTSRRKSGGDVKKLGQKSHKSPSLVSKSKSDESVDAKTTSSQQEVTKGERSPRKRRDKAFISEKSSPQLLRANSASNSKRTHSAPTTPDVRSKENFHFNTSQSEQQNTIDSQRRASGFATATQYHENKRASITPVAKNTLESSVHESSVNISLLRMIRELHEDAIAKVAGQQFHGGDQNEHPDSVTKSKAKSPLELLDEFIECGTNLHTLQLSRIPITSHFDTDWTYFGGTTPADELSILKTQVDLIEVQLQYERYKCDQHVLRNRRLVGKVHKAQAFEDESDGLKSQISSLDCELSEVKYSLKHQVELNKRLQDFCRTSEDQQREVLEQHSIDNNKLRCRVEELIDEVAMKEADIENARQELKSVQHELFEKTAELEQVRRRLELNDAVKAKADYVSKALVTYQDKYDRIKRQFQRFELNYVGDEEGAMEIESLKHELREYKSEREDLVTSLDAAKVRIAELENALAKKEISVRDMKNSVDQIHQKHTEEVKILEERYKCLKKATQGMESYILYLFTKIEEKGRDLRSHVHASTRRKACRNDKHEKSSGDKNHGDEGSGEYSTNKHHKHHSQLADLIDADTEGTFKDSEDARVKVLAERHPTEHYRTFHSYEGQSPTKEEYKSTHNVYSGSDDDKTTCSWVESEARSHDNDDDKDKHVHDSGIESSGVV